MESAQSYFAIFLIIFSTISLILLYFLEKKKWLSTRPLTAFKNFYHLIGYAIEQGKRVHLSLGHAKIEQLPGASSIISLTTLQKLAELSNLSEKPPIVTSGSGDLAILSQDIIRNSYLVSNALDRFDSNRVYMSGLTRFAYIAGALPVLGEDVAVQSVIGNFGAEVGILLDAASRKKIISLAATAALPGQATAYAMADEAVISEELFAMPANLDESAIPTVSLYTQDILRVLAIGILVVGCLLKLVGIL